MSTTMHDRIIWSADAPNPYEVDRKLRLIGQPIIVKLDRLFHRKHGDRFDLHLRDHGFRVFNDAKLIEIPSKLQELAEIEIELTRPWMLNCMAGSLSTGLSETPNKEKLDGLKRFADVCLSHDVLACAVTVLTSKEDEIVDYEFGGRTPIDQVLLYVEYLLKFGFTDVVCSPQEAAAIRAESRFDSLKLNTPAIRMPNDDKADQARTAAPGEAIRNGVDRLVIGRPITNNDNPSEAVELIAADMALAV